MTRLLTKTILILAAGSLIACGGGKKGAPTTSGLGDKNVPKPPDTTKTDGNDGGGTKAADISKDAREDYEKAAKFYVAQEKAGWTKANCDAAADRFKNVAKDHGLIEARYMAGRSYSHCQMDKKAEKQYQGALQLNTGHSRSLSNLGEIYYRAGKIKGAKEYWDAAVKADAKITAARNNLAYLLLEKMRETTDKKKWKTIETDAKDHLSSVLAVDNDNVKAYVLYGLIYMEGYERNKNRLDLAKLLLDEGAKRDAEYAPLWNARGLLQMRRNNLGTALKHFGKAVDLDDGFVEARMNVGMITLGFRKYETAEEMFNKVLELGSKNYDALIGLGIAQRGLKKYKESEDRYNEAMKLDKKRSDAYFNLGVLYKDFYANDQGGEGVAGLKGSKKAYEKARDYFKDFLKKDGVSKADKKEADANIADCDKIIKQLGEVIKAMEQDAASSGGS